MTDFDYLLQGDPREVVIWRRKSDIWGDPIRGSRATIAQLEFSDQRALKRFGVGLEVMQGAYNSDISKSAGTHDFDRCIDCFIPRLGWWESQHFLRFECLQFAWYRQPWQGFSEHVHMVSSHTIDTRVGEFVPGQIDDYFHHAYGLKDLHTPGSDRSPFPDPIRRFDYNQWRDDNMPLTDAEIAKIADKAVNKLLTSDVTLSDGSTIPFSQAIRRAAQMPDNLDATKKAISDLIEATGKSTNAKVVNARQALMTKLDEIDSQVG